ncbi:MAG: pilus assembly protein PilM [Planctomycetota bacterium]
MESAVGIDLGSRCLKAVRIGREAGRYFLLRAGHIEVGEMGPGHEEGGGLESVALRELLRGRGMPRGNVTAGIAGNQVILRYMQVPQVPLWKLKMLMAYELQNEMGAEKGAVTTDYRLLNLPSSLNYLIVMAAFARTEFVEGRLSVLRKGGIRPRILTAPPLALHEAAMVAVPPGEGKTDLILSLGARTVDLVIRAEDRLYFARNLPAGDAMFTAAVAREFNTPFAEAERIKHERGRLSSEAANPDTYADAETRRLGTALKGVADALFTLVQSSMLYARSQLRIPGLAVHRVFLTGGESRLPGLAEYLGKRLDLPVAVMDPLANFDLSRLPSSDREAVERNRDIYATASGMALLGLAGEAASLNLLPERVFRQRRFWRSTVYRWGASVAAGAALAAVAWGGVEIYRRSRQALGEERFFIEGAKVEEAKFLLLKAEHDLYRAMESALRKRVFSARDLMEIFLVLREKTPREIIITKFSTLPASDPVASPVAGPARIPAVRDGPTFQSGDFVIVDGRVRTPGDVLKAKEILGAYQEALKTSPLIAKTDVLRTPAVDERSVLFDKDEKIRFQMKLQLAKRD